MTRIDNLVELGKRLAADPALEDKIYATERRNPWFTEPFVRYAFNALLTDMLSQTELNEWLKAYELKEVNSTIGLIFAGNVPLVGFHDFLCCYVTGAKMKIKLSSKDDLLFPYIIQHLQAIDSALTSQLEIVETLTGFKAVIATGSNNTNRYFEYYFRNYPKILRKNRNSVAILTGEETPADLEKLADDVFLYFGFGCRNVSKLYVPTGYDLTQLFPVFEKKYKWLHSHNKFMNNYDYSRTILMLNKTPHIANEFLMLVENPSIPSSIATLNYELWDNSTILQEQLANKQDIIQCSAVLRPNEWNIPNVVKIGNTQHPSLSDYADGIDTLSFVLKTAG